MSAPPPLVSPPASAAASAPRRRRAAGDAPLILLLGAGHAHLHVLKHAADHRRRGASVTAVSPGGQWWYSGMATGMLGGQYDVELDRVDAAALGREHGVAFVDARALRIDAGARAVALDDGRTLQYDVLSLNVGSVVPPLPGGADHPRVFDVKPINRLWALRKFLNERRIEARVSGGRAATRIVVAGGGATGCEIAANAAALIERRGGRAEVTIVSPGTRLLEQLPAGAARDIERRLRERGIDVLLERTIERIDETGAWLSDGGRLDFDALVNATGLKPPSFIAASGLPVSSDGALLVDRHLRSVGDDRIFGAGDCAAMEGHCLARVGVYAVRQAPVLHANLLAAVENRPLRTFRPQRHFLSIMNLGDGTALAWRDGLWWHGRSALALKDWIDRRFVEGYRAGTRRRT